jgi:hypothetical protein
LSTYASEWEEVIEDDGTWNGLTMGFPVVVEVNGEGTVTGCGSYAVGTSVTLTATPSDGFVFCGWSESSAKSETYTFIMPAEAVKITTYFVPQAAVETYVKTNELLTREDVQELALSTPIIEVKEGVATVRVQIMKASTLDGEWEAVENGEVSVEIEPKADEKAAFYKFVVPNEQ